MVRRKIFHTYVKLWSHIQEFYLITNSEDIIFVSYLVRENYILWRQLEQMCENKKITLKVETMYKKMIRKKDFYVVSLTKKSN